MGDRTQIVLATLAGLLAFAILVEAERPTAGHEVAQMIERGIERGRTVPPDPEAIEDERLTGSANEAGYRWAERRGLTNVADCPDYAQAFREGCLAYVRDQGR